MPQIAVGRNPAGPANPIRIGVHRRSVVAKGDEDDSKLLVYFPMAHMLEACWPQLTRISEESSTYRP